MNDGFINEKELIDYINSNTFNSYSDNIKNFLKFIFGNNFNNCLPFHSEKINGQVKPDILVSHNNIAKYISIKKGSGNSVHQENISEFFPFISSILDEKSLEYLKLFHYGDGTTNDTGTTRYNANECKRTYSKEIEYLNNKLNQWENLSIFLDRFLFLGNVGDIYVDAIYHGSIHQGIWASKEEITRYINNSTFNNNTVHFGPLSYQVWGRNENRTAVHPNRRYVMQVKWSSLYNDLKNIRGEDNE